MMTTTATPDMEPAPATARDDEQAAREPVCLRPFCCNPFAAFSAFSRVGGWAPPLPDAQATQGKPGGA